MRICEPNTKLFDGEHMHRCERCHAHWIHDDDKAGNVAEHTCPTCAQEQWSKFREPQCCYADNRRIYATVPANEVERILLLILACDYAGFGH